jgi:aminoglycoside N3'-acetyltransferase
VAGKAVVTKNQIKRGFRALGLRKGDIIGVHSSLSSFGHVEGGADAVIDAMLETIGKASSAVVPSYSDNRERLEIAPEEKAMGVTWKTRILPFDPKTAACWTGKIPDTFWRRQEAVRGTQRLHSLSAIGPQAGELIQGWHKLRDLDGYILLLGVTLRCCSSMHLAEEHVQLPRYILERTTIPAELHAKYPADQWELGYGSYPDFTLMEGPCQERGIMKLVRIGDAVVRLVRLRELIDLYANYLRSCPEAFYHGCAPSNDL